MESVNNTNVVEDTDKLFKVQVLAQTPNPQRLIYTAMHQDYSSEHVAEVNISEEQAGLVCVNKLLKGKRGHYGPLEHPSMTVTVGYYYHIVMQQIRTHRLASFDVQSFRYTKVPDTDLSDQELHKLAYLRKPGVYRSRNGSYVYTQESYNLALENVRQSLITYRNLINSGVEPEHAREVLPMCTRQHFVMTTNLRGWLHILDLRAKPDAQLETVQFAEAVYQLLWNWAPQIMEYYKKERYKKANPAP